MHAFHVMSTAKSLSLSLFSLLLRTSELEWPMCQCVFGSVQTYFQSNLTSSNLNMEFSGKPRLIYPQIKRFFCTFYSSLPQRVQCEWPSNTTRSRLIWFCPSAISTIIIILFHSAFKIKIILHWSVNIIWIFNTMVITDRQFLSNIIKLCVLFDINVHTHKS